MTAVDILSQMSAEQIQLEAGIAAMEAQRAVLGDAVVDAALAGLHTRIAALRATAAPEPEFAQTQTLRQVSILFLDVVGSTTLSQRLDPEETSAVVDGVLRRATEIVQAHRGRVLQYAGDSILAAFGSEEAAEDDAERAVRCGLSLLELGRTLSAEVQAAHGHAGCDVRVGIHTGGVLLGGGGGGAGDESAIRGLAVNIAARMEQTAPAGALRISRDSYLQVRGLFEVTAQAPLAVKGVIDPIVSYLVRKAKPRSFRIASRGIEGVETRMIGRDAQLELLQEAFRRLYLGNAGLQRAVVVGEAGVGKSRLLYEFANWAESQRERFFVFQVRATPQTQSQPYGLLRDLLAWRLQIHDTDSMADARRKLEDGIVPLFVVQDGAEEAQAHAHLLGQLIGLDFTESKHIRDILDDGHQIRNRGFHAAAQMLVRIGSQGTETIPTVLQLDDLHWADDASLDFLDYLANVHCDVPMLMLALTRPMLFERKSAKVDVLFADALRIDLAPLDNIGSGQLANELLKKLPEIPAALHELVIGWADGNPFYMEELVKMLVDGGAIVTAGATTADHWTLVPDKLLVTKVPSTLTGVLQARLDGLPLPEKHALQLASVIGLNFSEQALAHIEPQAAKQLPQLAQRELIVTLGEPREGPREYGFKHPVLHQVTYATVLKSQRRSAHAKAAQWFASASGARANDFISLAAEHYAQAGDSLNACEYFTRAAEYAMTNYAHEVAIGHTERALGLARPDDAATRWRLLSGRERSLDLQGRREEQLADIGALMVLADALDDDGRRSEAAWRHGNFAMRTGDRQTGASQARRAAVLAQRAGAVELELRALQLQGIAITVLGDLAAGCALASQCLDRSRALGLRSLEGRFLNILTMCSAQQGDLAAVRAYSLLSLSADREVGNRSGEASALSNLGGVYLTLGAFALARQYMDEALRLDRVLGNRRAEGEDLITLSGLALVQGEGALALAHARAALDILVETGARPQQAYALHALGSAEMALGRWVAATAAFERGGEVTREIGSPADTPGLAAFAEGLARVALAKGNVAMAMAQIDSLLTNAQANAVGTAAAANGAAGPQDHQLRLTVYQVLTQAQDSRANAALERMHAALMTAADAIDDPELRHGFLTNIPCNREILTLWAGRGSELQSTG